MWHAGVDDTVLVAPGCYEVAPEYPWPWPIGLDPESPTIMSDGGAAVTILEGNGSVPAFRASGEYYGPRGRIRIIGFTIRNVTSPVEREDESGGRFLFTDNIVEDNGAGLDASWADGLIARNIIRRNGGLGIYIYHYFGIIEHNEICDSGTAGIGGPCCEEPEIRNNHVHGNPQGGILTGFYIHARDNLIEYNGSVGLKAYGTGSSHLEGNIIRFNDVGIRITGYAWISFHGNDIYGNTTYNLECPYYVSAGELDATMNWWGSTDPDEIAAGIYDCHDDPACECCVMFDPWCTAPGCEPTSVERSSWSAIKAIFR